MSLALGVNVLDGGMNNFALANKILICSAVPTTYAAANTNALGAKNFGIGNVFGALTNWVSGRHVTSAAITDGIVSSTGDAICWAVTDDANSRLLATGPLSPATIHVLSGQMFRLDSFVISLVKSGKLKTTSSAGVYNSTGKLVRTLWSAQDDDLRAANPAAAWDGRLDDLSTAPSGTYTVKLLQHHIKYTWEGVIGNTSPDHTTFDYHTYGTDINGMAITDGSHSPGGVGTEIYFIHEYDERHSTMHVTTEDNIQNAKYIMPQTSRRSYGDPTAICTDCIYAYIAHYAGAITYVKAIDCSLGKIANNPGYKGEVNFSYGIPEPGGITGTEQAAIGYGTNQYIYDVAVQKSGNLLFISRIETNTTPPTYSIWSLNKTTGQTIQHNAALGYATQWDIATEPATGKLWAIHSTGADGTARNKISQLVADAGGVLTETGVHVTVGLSDAIDLEVSPDGATLLVIDGGTSNQVKAYNTSDGTVKAAFGTSGAFGAAGGYINSPAVTDTKFMFQSPPTGFGGMRGWICFSSDGSFWVGDVGNHRYLHFSSGNSPTLLEKFSYLPAFYSCREIRGDPTRVISDYLEWRIDYSKPLAPNNGSWTLVNNWAAPQNMPIGADGNPYYEQYTTLKFATVGSNGRTYCFVYSNVLGWLPTEMTTSGLRLITGTPVSFQNAVYLDPYMNLWFIQTDSGGTRTVSFCKNAFAGFDGSNNPTWQLDQNDPQGAVPWPVTFTTETLPADFPIIQHDIHRQLPVIGTTLSNGIIPVYTLRSANYDMANNAETSNHFGGIDSVTGKVMFSVHPPTPLNFGQAGIPALTYPEAPFFPLAYSPPAPGGSTGSGQNAAGSMVYIPGHAHVFTNYFGEEFGNGQANMYSHWHESGLLLGRFGATMAYFALESLAMPKVVDGETDYTSVNANADTSFLPTAGWDFKATPGAGGNAAQTGLTFVDGKYYLFHNDEWYHAGLHRWRVDGVDSLQVSTQSIFWNGTYTPPTPNPYNMLEGLPYNSSSVPNGAGGWIRSPVDNIFSSNPHFPSGTAPLFDVTTNLITCDPFKSPDLCFRGILLSTGITATLSKAIPRNNTGNWTIDTTVLYPADNNGPDLHILILDGAGKIIAKMYDSYSAGGYSLSNFWVNWKPADASSTPPYPKGIAPYADNSSPDPWWHHYALDIHPLVITGDVGTGKLTVTFGKYTLSNIDVYEVGADITSPAIFRLEMDGTGNSAVGYIDIIKLNFIE